MFLLVPAYPGCPGSKAVKRSLLLLLLFLAQFSATESSFMGMSVSTLVIHAKTTIPIEMSVGAQTRVVAKNHIYLYVLDGLDREWGVERHRAT